MLNPYESPQASPERAPLAQQLQHGLDRGRAALGESLRREGLSKTAFIRACIAMCLLLPLIVVIVLAVLLTTGLQWIQASSLKAPMSTYERHSRTGRRCCQTHSCGIGTDVCQLTEQRGFSVLLGRRRGVFVPHRGPEQETARRPRRLPSLV